MINVRLLMSCMTTATAPFCPCWPATKANSKFHPKKSQEPAVYQIELEPLPDRVLLQFEFQIFYNIMIYQLVNC